MSIEAKAVIDWLSQVLEASSTRAPASRPLLLPAALSEHERWTPLIREVFELADGVVVDASKAPDRIKCGDVERDSPDLVEALRAFVTNYVGRTGDSFSLKIESGAAWIESSVPTGVVNAGQRTIRQIILSLCSAELRSTDLTAFLYVEATLDRRSISDVWNLLMRLPELLGSRAGSVLSIVACEGRVNYDLHAAGARSLRYRISDSGLQVRHRHEISMEPIRELSRHDAAAMPTIVLFLGAGASVADGLPTGDTLRNEALGRERKKVVTSANFMSEAAAWFDHLEIIKHLSPTEIAAGKDAFVASLTLERVIQEEQEREGQPFTSTLRRFAQKHDVAFSSLEEKRLTGGLTSDGLGKIADVESRFVFVTVNFDRLIEARVGPAKLRSFVTESDMEEFPAYLREYAVNGGRIPLLKMHGDISVPDSLVANLEETAAGLTVSREKALEELIRFVGDQQQRPWWYVGYSMRDRDLDAVWSRPVFAGFNEHWVSPFGNDSVRHFIELRRSRQWRIKGGRATADTRHISMTSGDFFNALYEEVVRHW